MHDNMSVDVGTPSLMVISTGSCYATLNALCHARPHAGLQAHSGIKWVDGSTEAIKLPHSNISH